MEKILIRVLFISAICWACVACSPGRRVLVPMDTPEAYKECGERCERVGRHLVSVGRYDGLCLCGEPRE